MRLFRSNVRVRQTPPDSPCANGVLVRILSCSKCKNSVQATTAVQINVSEIQMSLKDNVEFRGSTDDKVNVTNDEFSTTMCKNEMTTRMKLNYCRCSYRPGKSSY